MLNRSLAQEHRRRRQEKLFNKGIKDPGRCHFPCRHPASPPHLALHTAQCSLSLFTYRSSELNQRNPCARARQCVQHVGWQPAKDSIRHSCQQIYNEEKPRKGLSRSLKNSFGTQSRLIRCDGCVNFVNKYLCYK